jgi:hypothetical protein
VGVHKHSFRCGYPPPRPSPARGEGEERTPLAFTPYGVIEIGEKSTNQLLGCTKPLIFGLSARGPTSWAT